MQTQATYYTYGVDTSVLPSRNDCVVPPRDRNPFYPLAPLHDKLSPKEQSWWRVNACCIQRTPEEFTEAYAFFFYQYLWPRESAFLEDRRAPAPFHYRMVHDVGMYHYNAFGAPRHGCKTTVAKILSLLLILTRRGYRVGYLTSKQTKYREFVNDVRKQLSNNLLILRDFGHTKSSRGSGETWNSERAELLPPFNTSLSGMSLEGRERGWHGECLFIDDPEKDPDTDEVIPEYVRKLDTRLRYIFMPMVEIAPDDLHRREIASVGRTISYFGTVLGENMILNRILTAEPGGPYDAWNRWKFEQESLGHYLWPERWGKRSTAITRRVLGEDAFDSERQNRPGKSQKGELAIHPLFNTYHYEGVESDFELQPWESKGYIRWAAQAGNGHAWKALSSQEFLASLNIGLLVDPANTERVTATSDYTVGHVIGNDMNACLWSLDIVRGRWDTEKAIRELMQLCFKWRPTFIAIERCGLYARIADEILLHLNKQLLEAMGWVPYPREIPQFNKVTESKGLRIQRTAWRFRVYRIKFPWWRRTQEPYDQCWHEVTNFTRDLTKLKYDDIVDTIGLTPYVFSGPGGRRIQVNPWEGRSVEQLILEGHVMTPGGAHLIDMLPSVGDLSDEAMRKLEVYYNGRGQVKEKRLGERAIRPPRLISC